MPTDPSRVATRFLSAAAFKDALAALASQATLSSYYEEDEAADEIQEVLSEELRTVLQRIAKVIFAKMTHFQTQGTQEEWNGEESQEYDTYGDMMYTGYNITYPQTVTGKKTIFSRYDKLVQEFKANRFIKDFKLPDRAIDAFFAAPVVQKQIEAEVVDFAQELAKDEYEFYARGSNVDDRAMEVVYENSESDVTQTIYREEGEEEQHVVPDVRYSLRLVDYKPPKIKVTKADVAGGKITIGLDVTWDVRFQNAAFPWNWDYDRIVA